MAVGDVHIAGSDGWPLCGSNSPLRGYNATSPDCTDCRALERPGSTWKGPPTTTIHPSVNGNRSAVAMMRKRPTRLY